MTSRREFLTSAGTSLVSLGAGQAAELPIDQTTELDAERPGPRNQESAHRFLVLGGRGFCTPTDFPPTTQSSPPPRPKWRTYGWTEGSHSCGSR